MSEIIEIKWKVSGFDYLIVGWVWMQRRVWKRIKSENIDNARYLCRRKHLKTSSLQIICFLSVAIAFKMQYINRRLFYVENVIRTYIAIVWIMLVIIGIRGYVINVTSPRRRTYCLKLERWWSLSTTWIPVKSDTKV